MSSKVIRREKGGDREEAYQARAVVSDNKQVPRNNGNQQGLRDEINQLRDSVRQLQFQASQSSARPTLVPSQFPNQNVATPYIPPNAPPQDPPFHPNLNIPSPNDYGKQPRHGQVNVLTANRNVVSPRYICNGCKSVGLHPRINCPVNPPNFLRAAPVGHVNALYSNSSPFCSQVSGAPPLCGVQFTPEQLLKFECMSKRYRETLPSKTHVQKPTPVSLTSLSFDEQLLFKFRTKAYESLCPFVRKLVAEKPQPPPKVDGPLVSTSEVPPPTIVESVETVGTAQGGDAPVELTQAVEPKPSKWESYVVLPTEVATPVSPVTAAAVTPAKKIPDKAKPVMADAVAKTVKVVSSAGRTATWTFLKSPDCPCGLCNDVRCVSPPKGTARVNIRV